MIAQSSGTVLALNRSTPRVTLLSKPVNETEERIQFTGARLATEETAAHALSEHVVDGFYMKEITYPLGYRVPSHWHTNASLFIVKERVPLLLTTPEVLQAVGFHKS